MILLAEPAKEFTEAKNRRYLFYCWNCGSVFLAEKQKDDVGLKTTLNGKAIESLVVHCPTCNARTYKRIEGLKHHISECAVKDIYFTVDSSKQADTVNVIDYDDSCHQFSLLDGSYRELAELSVAYSRIDMLPQKFGKEMDTNE